ncbi:hypothetical protein LP419_37590 [Massilia sp. H-1]|nr:hypothetical protein LP419_37590 [Massilia sp. H-1]
MKYFVLSVILLMFNGLARADAVADECGMTSCTGHLIRDGHTGVFRMDGGSPTNGGGKSRSKKIDKKDEPPLKLDPIVATAVDPCQRKKILWLLEPARSSRKNKTSTLRARTGLI